MSAILLLLACSNKDRKLIKDNVYLEKTENNEYNLIFDPGKSEEWVFTCVDSLSVSTEDYIFLFYGISNNSKEKKWHFVVGAKQELKKNFGGWYDGEFRKYRLKEISPDGKIYSDLKSTNQIWEEL